MFSPAESGTYLGVDLGGTNFRIVRVDMHGDDVKTDTKYYELPKPLLSGPAVGVRKFANFNQSLRSCFIDRHVAEHSKTHIGN